MCDEERGKWTRKWICDEENVIRRVMNMTVEEYRGRG
jgi:hypothetical protein